MLDQIAPACAVSAGIAHEFSYAVELLVAWKDEKPLAGLSSLLVFLFDFLDELTHEVEHAVARPSLLPEIARGESLSCRRHGRIAGSSEFALIEGQEPCFWPVKVRGYVNQVRIHREVRQTAPVGKQWFPRIAIVHVLADRVLNVLGVKWIFKFRGENRNAVQEQHEVEALLILRAVTNLPYDRKQIPLIKPPRFLVKSAGGSKVRKRELTARVLDPYAQHV